MSVTHRPVRRLRPHSEEQFDDDLTVEEGLEIVIDDVPYAMTMRMPGEDRDLALGFCFTEGLICGPEEVEGMEHCAGSMGEGRIFVRLARGGRDRAERLARQRGQVSKSSCGLCGKGSLAEVHADIAPVSRTTPFTARALWDLREKVLGLQEVFALTGSTHSAAVADVSGEVLAFAEDIGRHNALDKAIGKTLRLGLRERAHTVLVSSRLSYEMVLKAGMLGAEVLAGQSAPTSLAVDLGGELGMTVIGFLERARMNVYTRPERVLHEPKAG